MSETPRENVYNSEIAPLMAKIIDVCRAHGIPLVASFELDPQEGSDDDDPLMCSTITTPAWTAKSMNLRHAAELLQPPKRGPVAMLKVTNADGSKNIIAVLP